MSTEDLNHRASIPRSETFGPTRNSNSDSASLGLKEPFELGPPLTGLDPATAPPEYTNNDTHHSRVTPPALPRAPTFDSPGRFEMNTASYPSPIQAGFRTPTSKKSASTKRSASSLTVARALTFGEEERDGQRSVDPRVMNLASPVGGSSSSHSARTSGSASKQDDPKRPVTFHTNTWNGTQSSDRDANSNSMDHEYVGPYHTTERIIYRVPSFGTLGGRKSEPAPIVAESGSPVIPSSPVHFVEPAPFSSYHNSVPANIINMGEGLAGGPQRDETGRKINMKLWREADPLTASGMGTKEKKLGGFKSRFSRSLMNLLGRSDSQDEPRNSTKTIPPRRRPFERKSVPGSQIDLNKVPHVPVRTSSFKGRKKASISKPIPFSLSMPILSDSLRNHDPDDRIKAWLSTTSLVGQSTSGSMGGTRDRVRMPPIVGKFAETEGYSSEQLKLWPQKKLEPEPPIPAKRRPSSLARLSSLFSRRSSSKAVDKTPSPSIAISNGGDSIRQVTSRTLTLNLTPGEIFDSDSPWQKRLSGSDWKKMLLQTQQSALKPEEADHFATIIGLPPARTNGHGSPNDRTQRNGEKEAERPKLPSPKDSHNKRLSRLSEIAEEDQDHIKPRYKSIGIQTEVALCPHCASSLPSSGSSSRHNHNDANQDPLPKALHKHRFSDSSNHAPSELTESVLEEDAHIQTVLSSPVHSVPMAKASVVKIRKFSTDSNATSLLTPPSPAIKDGFAELQFPLPPGYDTIRDSPVFTKAERRRTIGY